MLGRTSNLAAAIAMASLCGGLSGGNRAFANEITLYPNGWQTSDLISVNGGQSRVGRYPRSGHRKTAAQQKRASRKAKNVKRHRAASRG